MFLRRVGLNVGHRLDVAAIRIAQEGGVVIGGIVGTQSPAAHYSKARLDPRVMERIHLCRVVGPECEMAGGALLPRSIREAHVIAAHQAKTGRRLIRPFEFYQRGQHGGVEVLTGVKTHHLDFNMIEHGDSLCCLGVETPSTLPGTVEMGIE